MKYLTEQRCKKPNRLDLAVMFLILQLIIFATGCQKSAGLYNVLDFGAKGDSGSLNTKSINTAIEVCHKNGGGTVVFPAGRYLSGSIHLLSNVTLRFENGAILEGSKAVRDYFHSDTAVFNEGYASYGLIYALDATNIGIEGQGEINGNGTSFMSPGDKPHVGGDFNRKFTRQGEKFMPDGATFDDGPILCPQRPEVLILFERCGNIHISDITIRDAPFWTVRIGNSDNATVRGISILNNMLIPNNDGIHCADSRNIRISDCNIIAGDDAVIVSGLGNEPAPGDPAFASIRNINGNRTGIAEFVTVTNCVLASRSAGIRVGYGKRPIRNCVFSNLVIHDSNRGIGIFARENSVIENMRFSNIVMHTRLHSGHWWGKGEPIHISAMPNAAGGNSGRVSNICFSDITAFAETGILIYGNSRSVIENITLDKIWLRIDQGKYTNDYGGNIDLRPAYPLSEALFKHDIPALFARYVKNLSLRNLDLTWGTGLPDFFTNGIEATEFENITIDNFCGNANGSSVDNAAIKLINGNGALISGIRNTSGKSLMKINVR